MPAPVGRKGRLAKQSRHGKNLSKIYEFNMKRHLSIYDRRQMDGGPKTQTYQSTL